MSYPKGIHYCRPKDFPDWMNRQSKDKHSSLSIYVKYHTWENSFIPAVLQIFNAEFVAQLLYGIPIWISKFDISVERVQAMFLNKIFGVLHCVPSCLG